MVSCGCSSADGESLGGGLSGSELKLWLIGLLHINSFLGAVELNMAVGGKVWADATVGTVGSSAAGDSALSESVGDDTSVDIEFLALSVSLEVDEEFTNDLDGLLWPSSLLVLEFFQHGVSASGTIEPSEWNNLLVLEDILQVSNGALDAQSLDGTSNFVSVLEVSSEVSNLALGGYFQSTNCESNNYKNTYI